MENNNRPFKSIKKSETTKDINERLIKNSYKFLQSNGIRRWLYTVSNAKRNNKPLSVVCGLDSLTAGSGNTSYIDYFRPKLQSVLGDGGLGYVAINTTAIAPEYNGSTSPLGMSGGTGNTNANFDVATDDIYDPNLLSTNFASNGYMNYIDNSRTFDRADIYYLKQPSGGTFLWGSGLNASTIADMVNVTTSNATKSIAKTSYTRFGSSFGGGHMQAKSIVAPVRLLGVDIQKGITGVRVHRLAQGGTQARQVAQLDGAQYTNFLKLLGCDLFVLNCGMNDTAQTAETYDADVRTILTRVRSANPNCAILLVGMNDTNDSNKNNILESFRYKLHLVANDFDAMFIDIRWILGSYATALTNGLMLDGTHPNVKANPLIANALYDYIGGDFLSDIDQLLLI